MTHLGDKAVIQMSFKVLLFLEQCFSATLIQDLKLCCHRRQIENQGIWN